MLVIFRKLLAIPSPQYIKPNVSSPHSDCSIHGLVCVELNSILILFLDSGQRNNEVTRRALPWRASDKLFARHDTLPKGRVHTKLGPQPSMRGDMSYDLMSNKNVMFETVRHKNWLVRIVIFARAQLLAEIILDINNLLFIVYR